MMWKEYMEKLIDTSTARLPGTVPSFSTSGVGVDAR